MSLVKNEKVESNKRELEIFVDAKTFQDACKRVYFKDIKRINVPGFRKGKAPKKVVEKIYGHDVFFSSALDFVYPKAVDDAVREAELDVVGVEKLEPLEMSEEKGCSFKVVCILKPEAEIGNYKGIEVKAVDRKVSDEDVQHQVNILRERGGRLINVDDRAAQDGDLVLLDFEGFVDGKAFSGGKAKNYSLKLGSGQFVDGFESQVVGHKIGEEFEVNVVFPETYIEENLKGKPAKFKCKLNEIKFLQLPDEDDEFAKDVSKFDTLKELKDDIRSHLVDQFKKRFDDQVNSEILNFLAKNVVVQIPEVMLLNRVDDLAKNFENNLASQGLTLEQYLKAANMSGYVLKDSLKAQADFQIRTDLALEKIAKLEKLEPVSDDYDAERKIIAESYKLEVEKVKDLFPDEILKSQLQNRKALDFLKNNAKISVENDAKISEGSASNSNKKTEGESSKASATKSAKTSQTKQGKSAKIASEKSVTDSKAKTAKTSKPTVKASSKGSKTKSTASKTKSSQKKTQK